MTTLPPELRAEILVRVKRTPSPDALQVRRRRVLSLAAGAAVAVAATLALGVSLGGRPAAFVALTVVGWGLVAWAASAVAGSRGRAMLGPPRARLVLVALASAPVLFAWLMACTTRWPGVRAAEGTLHAHLTCFFFTALLSLAPFAALASTRRAADPVHPRATGAAIGAAAGAWGSVLIDLHCPLSQPLHVALAHVLPSLLYAGLGALVGARLFGVRAPRER